MAMRTTHHLKCKCGHSGAIRMKENDAPFSKQYESYSLINLHGSGWATDGFADWDEVFRNMSISCPSCRASLNLNNTEWGKA